MDMKQAEARRELVYTLYAQGVALDEIATQVDQKFRQQLDRRYTKDDAARDLTSQGEVIENLEGLSREDRKILMSQRFQMLMKAAWPGAMAGDTKAMRIILQIMDREAALWGLDEPKKTVSISFDPRDEIRKYAREHNLNEDEEMALLMQVEDMLREKYQDSRR